LKEELNSLQIQLKDEFAQKTNDLVGSVEESSEELNRTKNDLQALSKKLGTEAEQLRDQIKENHESLEQILNSQVAELRQEISGITERVDEIHAATTTKFEEMQGTQNEIAQSLEKTSTILLDSISNSEKEFTKLANGLEIATKGLEQSQNLLENYSETINGQSSVIDSYRGELARLIDAVKAEEQDLLRAFQRILTGSIENVRNETLMIQKSLRKNQEELRASIEASYLLKKDHERLVEQFRGLEQDLRARAEETRQGLVKELEASVKEFQKSVQDSIESVRATKSELSDYKDEISSLIERKVNEKYDFAFDLISRTLTKSEQLVEIVTGLQLPMAPRPAVPAKPAAKGESSANNVSIEEETKEDK
jgi:ABC-type transporter Mla subunit MlaD